MAEKDIAEKTLEDYNDVFADIVNVLLFQGRRFVKENELEEESPDKEMKEKTGKVAPRYPVVTLVLYFGYDRHWKKPRTLFECLELPEEIKPYVNDYRMNLYEIAYLSDEQVQMFTSDFKIVADYFVQMQKNKNYVATEVTIKHVHELLQLMAVMTQDNRFENVYSSDMERGATTMCEVLDRIENRGIQKGEDTILSLMNYLLKNNRAEDAKKATEDKAYRNKLLTEIFDEKL